MAVGALAGCASAHSGSAGASGNSVVMARVQKAYVRFEHATLRLRTVGTSCQAAPAPTRCLAAADVSYGHAISEFAVAVGAVQMPAGRAAAEARQLVSAAARTGHDYGNLGISTTARQFADVMASTHLAQNATVMNQCYDALLNDLRATAAA
jgi:hypothetical protein